MTDEDIYYGQKDHDHDKNREWPDSIMLCVLACVGMFSYLCAYLLEQVK